MVCHIGVKMRFWERRNNEQSEALVELVLLSAELQHLLRAMLGNQFFH